jgi:hypothetical protein
MKFFGSVMELTQNGIRIQPRQQQSHLARLLVTRE